MTHFLIFSKLLLVAIAGIFNDSSFNITQVNTKQINHKVVHRLQKFEKSFTYPFNTHEEFTIQHGLQHDYFHFFKKLGQPYYYTAINRTNKRVKKIINNKEVVIQQKAGDIAAAGCCILRKIKNKNNSTINAWYLCDLKVSPHYQGEHLPITIFKKIALRHFIQCPRGFAICMNPKDNDPKAARIFKKHSTISGITTHTLNLYTLTADQFNQYKKQLQEALIINGYMKRNSTLGLTSTHGSKDYEIIDTDTQKKYFWHLLHIKKNANNIEPKEGATLMISAVQGTTLNDNFQAILGQPSSTAQILSYGMDSVDFNFLTSDQI